MSTKEQILAALCQSSGFLSGEELSARLGCSRTAVWKAVKSLRAAGHCIDSATNRGYRLISSPDALTENMLAGLGTHTLGGRLYPYTGVDSTNEAAKREAAQGAPAGSLFVADEQTGGKGRLGRGWRSPAGSGLWFSLLLHTGLSPLQIGSLTLVAGLAVCRAICGVTGLNAGIKWPNDVLLGTKKVCGILTELSAEMERVHYVVLGIGVNVNMRDFPDELAVKATSLFLESGREYPRAVILQAILRELEPLLEQYEADTSAFLSAYRPLCVTLGHNVRFFRKGLPVVGVAEDITLGGELSVRCKDNSIYNVSSGEVTVQGLYGEAL